MCGERIDWGRLEEILAGCLVVLSKGCFGEDGKLSISVERTILMCPFDRGPKFNKLKMLKTKIK